MITLRTLSCFLMAVSFYYPYPLRAADETKVAPALMNQKDLPAKYQEAAKSVAAVLASEKEDPREFKAEVQEKGETAYVFHLWHISAFTPGNKGAVGNPGGRCRDIVYDVKSRKASKSVFWQ